MNLTKKLNEAEKITIYYLASDGDADKKISKTSDGKHFYTTTPLNCEYKGNSVIAKLGSTSKVCASPIDNLYKTLEYPIEGILEDLGVNSKVIKTAFDKKTLKRTEYIADAGYGSGEISIAGIARKVIGLSTITLELGKSLPLINLMKVGDPVKLEPGTEANIKLGGKYLLFASLFTFEKKTGGWLSNCTVRLMRTNKDSS